MDLAGISDELYGLDPAEFTPVRDTRVSEARQAGDRALADELKSLRKPSVGAWLANQVSRECAADVKRLVGLGGALRASKAVDGEQIRNASKERQQVVMRLLREARSIAKREGQTISEATERDLESTLDAAFADSESADALRQGRLVRGLRYSGLGLGTKPGGGGAKGASRGRGAGAATSSSDEKRAAHKKGLEQAERAAEQADAEVLRARRAITAAEADLKRLEVALAVATRRAARAHETVVVAKKRVGRIRTVGR